MVYVLERNLDSVYERERAWKRRRRAANDPPVRLVPAIVLFNVEKARDLSGEREREREKTKAKEIKGLSPRSG